MPRNWNLKKAQYLSKRGWILISAEPRRWEKKGIRAATNKAISIQRYMLEKPKPRTDVFTLDDLVKLPYWILAGEKPPTATKGK